MVCVVVFVEEMDKEREKQNKENLARIFGVDAKKKKKDTTVDTLWLLVGLCIVGYIVCVSFGTKRPKTLGF